MAKNENFPLPFAIAMSFWIFQKWHDLMLILSFNIATILVIQTFDNARFIM